MDIRSMLNTANIEKAIKHGVGIAKDNLPIIFSASALGCLALGMYETAVATHKSDKQIAEEEARRAAELPLYENTELSVPEKVSLCWKNYIPAAMYGAASAFFIIAAERKSNEKYLALMSAYELARQAGDTRKEVELDVLGEDKTLEIDDQVKKRLTLPAEATHDDIQAVPGKGQKTLYYIEWSNTPFWATEDDILHAFNVINHKKADKQGVASINDFHDALGIRSNGPIGQDYGWSENDPMVEPLLERTTLIDDDPSMPATIVDFSIEPQYDFGNDRRQW